MNCFSGGTSILLARAIGVAGASGRRLIFELVAESITHGHQADIIVCLERFGRRSGPTAAAADQPNTDRVVVIGMDSLGERRRRRGRRRSLQEPPPIDALM